MTLRKALHANFWQETWGGAGTRAALGQLLEP
jgi:hypothetical protein